jgi:hypothetical protein
LENKSLVADAHLDGWAPMNPWKGKEIGAEIKTFIYVSSFRIIILSDEQTN